MVRASPSSRAHFDQSVQVEERQKRVHKAPRWVTRPFKVRRAGGGDSGRTHTKHITNLKGSSEQNPILPGQLQTGGQGPLTAAVSDAVTERGGGADCDRLSLTPFVIGCPQGFD